MGVIPLILSKCTVRIKSGEIRKINFLCNLPAVLQPTAYMVHKISDKLRRVLI